ncbi:unnamed protein product [Pleuronectes platessa]|uniref:Uncharacterized protein n=1 Tax=Pleuronectes platessa TaxID=8262 RepID=A0A9N7YSX6_PLEPL|nr:unnamed protein product [Pleuronectes platessa]
MVAAQGLWRWDVDSLGEARAPRRSPTNPPQASVIGTDLPHSPRCINPDRACQSLDRLSHDQAPLWKVDRVSCEPREQLSTGTGEAGVRAEEGEKTSSYVNFRSRLSLRLGEDSHEGDTLRQRWTVAPRGSGGFYRAV